MLTILNHHLLANKPVGKLGWVVEYCLEKKNYYEIILTNFASVKVRLQRTKTKMGSRNVYRLTNENVYISNSPVTNVYVSNSSVTIDYIRDINNLLKALEHFTK